MLTFHFGVWMWSTCLHFKWKILVHPAFRTNSRINNKKFFALCRPIFSKYAQRMVPHLKKNLATSNFGQWLRHGGWKDQRMVLKKKWVTNNNTLCGFEGMLFLLAHHLIWNHIPLPGSLVPYMPPNRFFEMGVDQTKQISPTLLYSLTHHYYCRRGRRGRRRPPPPHHHHFPPHHHLLCSRHSMEFCLFQPNKAPEQFKNARYLPSNMGKDIKYLQESSEKQSFKQSFGFFCPVHNTVSCVYLTC